MDTVECYLEEREYTWVKSKAKPWEVEAVDTFSKLWPSEYYPKNHLTYVLDEKQLYRAKHACRLKYVGRKQA